MINLLIAAADRTAERVLLRRIVLRSTVFASAALVASGVALMGAWSTPAQAIEPGAPERLITEEMAIVVKVRSALMSKIALAKDAEKERLTQISEFYAQRGNQPLWVGANGFGPNGQAVMTEIRNADAYGLDASALELPELPSVANAPAAYTSDQLAAAELSLTRSVMKYADFARNGRFDPERISKNLERTTKPVEAGVVLAGLSDGSQPGAFLRGLHPQHPQFEKLRQKYLAARGHSDDGPKIKIPSGPALKPGDRHEQIVMLRERLDVPSPDGVEIGDGGQTAEGATATSDIDLYDETLVEAVRGFQDSRGLEPDAVVGPGTRAALNGTGGSQAQRLLVNMERFRWLPDNMSGSANQYVWVNVPEFTLRVMRNANDMDKNKASFTTRVVAGKVSNPTPIFSDEIEWVEFHPVWYVPNSIKTLEILPGLMKSNSVLERNDLRVDCGKRSIEDIRSGKIDIRSCNVTQGPGVKNVLGFFKFKLPNKHDVYLHDTPSRSLFSQNVRTFSHGCVRVQNPERLAEALLGNDQGMSSAAISAIVSGPRRTQSRYLNKHVPVHITYFTTWVDEEGTLRTYGDYYGYDRRIGDALNGRGHLLGSAAMAEASSARPQRVAENAAQPSRRSDWQRDVFSGGGR